MNPKTDTNPNSRLIIARKARSFSTAKEAAEAFGWKVPTYTQHENGIRALSRKAADRYAAAFGVDPGFLLYGIESLRGRPPTLRFGGIIGAGHKVIPFDDLATDIPGIIGENGGEVFEVSGDSMIPVAWPGDFVFFAPPRNPTKLIGHEAIVELTDGTRLFKTIERGSKVGLFNLISYNSIPMRDIEITRAGQFLGVKRKK